MIWIKHLLLWLLGTTLKFSFASRNEFELIETSDCMCPGQSITYECTVVVAHGVFTIWTGSIMEAGCEIILINSQQASEFLHQQRVCNGGAVVGRGVEVHDNCYTSQVTVLLTSDLDHRTIQCSSADTGDSTITIGEAQILLTTEPFPPPTNVHLIVSSRKLTFSWTPPTQECSSLSYFVMASGCGECQVNTTLTSTTCHVGRNFTLPSLCTLKVYTSICGNLTSRDPSTPISIILAVPKVTILASVPQYSGSDGRLLRIVSNFTEINTQYSTPTFFFVINYTDSRSNSYCGSNLVLTSSCEDPVYTVSFDASRSFCPSYTDINVTMTLYGINYFGNGPPSETILQSGVNNFVNVTFSPTERTFTCVFHNQPPVLKYCTANISYGFNCSEVLGTYRGSSNTNSVTTTVISMVGGVTEYCYNVTANVENNMTVHMVVVEGTLNLHVEDSIRTTVVLSIFFGAVVPLLCGAICVIIAYFVRRIKRTGSSPPPVSYQRYSRLAKDNIRNKSATENKRNSSNCCDVEDIATPSSNGMVTLERSFLESESGSQENLIPITYEADDSTLPTESCQEISIKESDIDAGHLTGDHEMTTSHERKEFAQCADTGFESQEGTAILERNDGRNKMTSVPSAYFTVATMTANVPFLHYRLLEANYDGLEHTLIDHDVTVRIPKGAVPMGKKISLEIAVTMYGPFYHSGDAQPISPIIWLCLLDEDITLTKPFEVVIPHFLTKLTREKVLLHEIGFAKAHHENYSLNDDMHYHFLPCEENFLHASNKSRGYGILQTTHCCFYCIKSKKSPALASDASYCLVQYVSHSLGFQKTEIHFVAIYLLPTCMKALEEQYKTEEGYNISNRTAFKFHRQDDETEPYYIKLIHSDHDQCEIAMHPKAAMIRVSDIDFSGKDLEIMELLHEKEMYPPRIKMTIIAKSQGVILKIPVKFEGCSCDSLLDTELAIFPGLRSRSANSSTSSSSPSTCSLEPQSHTIFTSTKPRLKEVLKELLPLAANWKIIGTLLDVEKHILDNIEANKEVLGSQNRLHEMLSEWQKQVTPSPTWDLLADAIEDFDKSKAQDIRDKCVKR